MVKNKTKTNLLNIEISKDSQLDESCPKGVNQANNDDTVMLEGT